MEQNIELSSEEINNNKIKLMELNNVLKQYKTLNNIVNTAFGTSGIYFFYTYLANKDKLLISGSIFIATLFAKLYIEDKRLDKQQEYDKLDSKIRVLKKM